MWRVLCGACSNVASRRRRFGTSRPSCTRPSPWASSADGARPTRSREPHVRSDDAVMPTPICSSSPWTRSRPSSPHFPILSFGDARSRHGEALAARRRRYRLTYSGRCCARSCSRPPTPGFASPSCSGCGGVTSTGPHSGFASGTLMCVASTRARESPTSAPAARCPSPTAWPRGCSRGMIAPRSSPTTTSSSHTRCLARRWTGPRSRAGSNRPAPPPACRSSRSTTYDTRSRRGSQPRESRSESYKSFSATRIKTTQIYAHYAPSTREVELVNETFGRDASR